MLLISASSEVQGLIVSEDRDIKPRAVIDLIDPDLIVGAVTSSGEMAYSRTDQLHDKVLLANKYMTTEFNRTVLDGTFGGFPEDAASVANEIGVVLDELSDENGEFSGLPYVEMAISGVGVLQAMSVVFPGNYADGYGVDFGIEIYSGVTLAYSESVTDNAAFTVQFDGFTVYTPTSIKIIFSKWSLPGRYPRVTEILPGSYEDWDGQTIYSLDVQQNADFSCMSLPYGTASLEIYNENNRFDPRNKDGMFASLEDRQSIACYTAVKLADETYEYIPNGVFYMLPDGWGTNKNGLTFAFKMVDIVGLIRDRKFDPTNVTSLTTCEDWIAEIISQLGSSFEGKYSVDSSIASETVTCAVADVENVTCGNLLRWICMYVGAYPRADAESGYLIVEPVSTDVVGEITEDNQYEYPTQSANNDVAAITFRLNDGSLTSYTITGTTTASSKTLSIANPFVTSSAIADTVARRIINYYGGQIFSVTSRGNPALEIGDMSVLGLGLNAFAAGRIQKQQLKIDSKGVMSKCKSTILQATGDTVYKTYVILTEDGDFEVPAGVTALNIVLVGGGDAGTDGEDGVYDSEHGLSSSGAPGDGGLGGKVYIATISVTPLDTLSAVIGTGGTAPGGSGTETTFAGHTSASGDRLNGWSDFTLGNVYGKDGADGKADQSTAIDGAEGTENTGNGGGGGSGGMAAIVGEITTTYPTIIGLDGRVIMPETTLISYYKIAGPFDGGLGADGGGGVVIISYEAV